MLGGWLWGGAFAGAAALVEVFSSDFEDPFDLEPFLLSVTLSDFLVAPLATRLAHELGGLACSSSLPSSVSPESFGGEFDRDLDFPPLLRLRFFFPS